MSIVDETLRDIFKKIHEDRNKEIVYKQDVVDIIITWIVEKKPDMKIPIDLIGKIYDLPSPHKSKWIPIMVNKRMLKCSNCSFWVSKELIYDYTDPNPLVFKYCPNCGCQMEGEGR